MTDFLLLVVCLWTAGVNGIAGMTPETLAEDLEPLFATIVKEVRPGCCCCLPVALLLASGERYTHA